VTELPDDVRALVEGPNYAHIATLLPNGAPHSVPVWLALEGDRIAFLNDPTSRKARNIARDPRVAISVTDHANPFAMGEIRGRVTERLDGDAALAVIDRISRKHTGQPYPPRSDRVVFLVDPEHARAMTYA
jgi:PPOX class probable F420-dependent enzyme